MKSNAFIYVVVFIFTYMIIRYTNGDSVKNKGELLLFDDINMNKTIFSSIDKTVDKNNENIPNNTLDNDIIEDDTIQTKDTCENEQNWVKKYNELRKNTRMGDDFKNHITKLQKNDI